MRLFLCFVLLPLPLPFSSFRSFRDILRKEKLKDGSVCMSKVIDESICCRIIISPLVADSVSLFFFFFIIIIIHSAYPNQLETLGENLS